MKQHRPLARISLSPWETPLEPLPIATSLQAYQASEARRWKMTSHQGRVFGLDTVENLASHLRCQRLIHFENHGPIRLGDLRRMNGDITQNQGALAA